MSITKCIFVSIALYSPKNSKNSHFYVLVYSTGLAALAVTANATQRILYEFYGSNHDQTKPYFVFYLRIMMMMINTSTH